MTIEEIKNLLHTPAYEFLTTDPKLGSSIILLGLGGSYAYGTNIETSDVDIRGIAMNSSHDLLIGRDFEQVVETNTDTTIYSLDKIFKLLTNCNPNVIELLGLMPEQYLLMTDVGKELIAHRQLFLSQKAIVTFGGYASMQLNRLVNKSGRAKDMVAQNEERSMNRTLSALRRDGIIDDGVRVSGKDNALSISINGTYPMEQFVRMSQAILNVHSDYANSSRNKKAIEHNKLNKHAMHLVRLYYMAFDILEKGEINTYRHAEHSLLMDIRNGKYIVNDEVLPEFYDLLESLKTRFNYACKYTELPVEPDYDAINELHASINLTHILKTTGESR